MENNNFFNLSDYRDKINLDTEFIKVHSSILDEDKREIIIDDLMGYFSKENVMFNQENANITYKDKRNLIRALLNVREAKPIDESILVLLNHLLQSESLKKGIVDVNSLKSVSETIFDMNIRHNKKIILWKDDITKINSDVIINAANNRMLGCFRPLHNCIDNVIHSSSGPQLRDDCNKIITLQGKPESVGLAKITRAYNLPSKFVIHTIGPNVSGLKNIITFHKNQLSSCYKECLNLANQIDSINSITFCSISTGVSDFPKNIAAEIALKSTINWLDHNPNKFTKIIFNVYSDYDYSVFIKAFYRVKEDLKYKIF
ncbi:MAG: protein-ADP-ribose hydrolase [Clostridiales bacterium]